MESIEQVRAPALGGPIRRNQAGSRLSRFVFTLNNYTEEEVAFLKEFGATTKWFVMGKEVGESGTLHLQGILIHNCR